MQPRRFSWGIATLACIALGLLVAGLSAVVQSDRLSARVSVPAAATATIATGPVGSATSYTKPEEPSRLIIPAIGVDAHVQSVGLSWRGDGTMAVPTNFTDVGWYNKGALPGMPGSAVIDGHVDGANTPRAVFYDLGRLVPGDLVEVVDAAGKTVQFKVVATKTYDYDADTSEIFSDDVSKTRLNLITCTGDWDRAAKRYDKRIVVFTELVAT